MRHQTHKLKKWYSSLRINWDSISNCEDRTAVKGVCGCVTPPSENLLANEANTGICWQIPRNSNNLQLSAEPVKNKKKTLVIIYHYYYKIRLIFNDHTFLSANLKRNILLSTPFLRQPDVRNMKKLQLYTS